MVFRWRLVNVGGILTLSVGVGLHAILVALGQQAGTAPPMLVALGCSFCVAYILLQTNPAIETQILWRFSGLVFVLFILGNAISPNSFYAPMGEDSPLVIGGLWLLSLAIGYAMIFKGGYRWFKQRVISK